MRNGGLCVMDGMKMETTQMSTPATVRPIMYLDDTLPITHMLPIDPVTGKVWEEKMWELIELATDARYESDEVLRNEALAKYHDAKEDVTFEPRPFFQKSTFILGAAHSGLTIPETFHCNPETWEALPQAEKDKYDVRQTDAVTTNENER